jgi:hypothetical protein
VYSKQKITLPDSMLSVDIRCDQHPSPDPGEFTVAALKFFARIPETDMHSFLDRDGYHVLTRDSEELLINGWLFTIRWWFNGRSQIDELELKDFLSLKLCGSLTMFFNKMSPRPQLQTV